MENTMDITINNRYCQHNKFKPYCRECGGSQICQHDKIKRNCRDCGGSSFCEHRKQRYYCKDCGGGGFCPHGNRKSRCLECGKGSEICCHKRVKTTCKDCGGSQICQHNKSKRFCNLCNTDYLCIHGKIKKRCIECEGSDFCLHGKRKTRCKECGGKELCPTHLCETLGNPKYEGYCLPCFVNNPENRDKPAIKNYKTKEKEVGQRIIEKFQKYTWISDKKVKDGCSRRRPDFLLDLETHIIIVEVDENSHSAYDCSCENKRLMELSQDLQHRPIVFIRFNPDDYISEHGINITSCWKLNKMGVMEIKKTKQKEWEERIKNLHEQIQYWIDNPTNKLIEVIQLYY